MRGKFLKPTGARFAAICWMVIGALAALAAAPVNAQTLVIKKRLALPAPAPTADGPLTFTFRLNGATVVGSPTQLVEIAFAEGETENETAIQYQPDPGADAFSVVELATPGWGLLGAACEEPGGATMTPVSLLIGQSYECRFFNSIALGGSGCSDTDGGSLPAQACEDEEDVFDEYEEADALGVELEGVCGYWRLTTASPTRFHNTLLEMNCENGTYVENFNAARFLGAGASEFYFRGTITGEFAQSSETIAFTKTNAERVVVYSHRMPPDKFEWKGPFYLGDPAVAEFFQYAVDGNQMSLSNADISFHYVRLVKTSD